MRVSPSPLSPCAYGCADTIFIRSTYASNGSWKPRIHWIDLVEAAQVRVVDPDPALHLDRHVLGRDADLERRSARASRNAPYFTAFSSSSCATIASW